MANIDKDADAFIQKGILISITMHCMIPGLALIESFQVGHNETTVDLIGSKINTN